MFYKRVNLTGPKGEKLQSWVAEKYADIGSSFRLVEDEKLRAWTVSESGDQLMLETQLDPRHVVNPIDPLTSDNVRQIASAQLNGGEAVPEAILRKPRKPKASKSNEIQ